MFEKEIMEEGMIIHHIIGWKELLFYNKNPPAISLPKGLTVYNKYKNHVKNVLDIYSYLINNFFSKNEFYSIRDADFSYYVSEYVLHKIIWFNPKYYNNINIDYNFVNKILKKRFNNFVIFENIQNNRSVKKIKHFHFFILKTSKYNIYS